MTVLTIASFLCVVALLVLQFDMLKKIQVLSEEQKRIEQYIYSDQN